MALRYDIRLNKDYINANNDVEWYASDADHMKKIISASPGSYKENPMAGVAIKNYLNSAGQQDELSRKIIIQLTADGYNCNNPIIQFNASGELTVDPNITQ